MPRLVLLLAALLSLWPTPAEASECVHETALRAPVEMQGIGDPAGALVVASGLEHLVRTDTGSARGCERRGGRSPLDHDGEVPTAVARGARCVLAAAAKAAAPTRLDIAPRLDPSPYYATAPPAAR